MTAFATLNDYSTAFPGQPTDPTTNAQVQQALNAACQEIRDYCNQQFDLITADQIEVHGTGRSTLVLPEVPVVAVNTVTINLGLPTEVDVTGFRIDKPSGVLYRPPFDPTTGWCGIPAYWPLGFLNVTVDYDHGYDPVPEGLIDVAVRFAKEKIDANPSRMTGESITNYSYTQTAGAVSVKTFADALQPFAEKRVPVP